MTIDTSGPFSRTMTSLADWLSTVDASVRFAPPGDPIHDDGETSTGAALCAWPIDLLPEQTPRTSSGPQPYKVKVRYLVTADGPGEQLARLLDPVLTAAASATEVSVVLAPVPADLWLAFGARPRAALFVDVPARVSRTAPVIPSVKSPLRLQTLPTRGMRGTVLGPGGEPVPGMRVEAPAVGTGTYTDSSGGFTFAGLPPGDLRLVLVGRGRYFHADVTAPAGEPVVIRCDFEEA